MVNLLPNTEISVLALELADTLHSAVCEIQKKASRVEMDLSDMGQII